MDHGFSPFLAQLLMDSLTRRALLGVAAQDGQEGEHNRTSRGASNADPSNFELGQYAPSANHDILANRWSAVA